MDGNITDKVLYIYSMAPEKKIFILSPVTFSNSPAWVIGKLAAPFATIHIILTVATLSFVDSLSIDHHPLEECDAKQESITLFMPQKMG